jgi:creatinine amidohydrolase
VSADPTPRVRLAELNRDELRVIAQNGGVAIIPIAATEQHGPHLPTGTDTISTDHVVLQAAESLAGRVPVVVSPILPYGCSAHHLPFGATASLSPQAMLAVLLDLGGSLVGSGFTKILIVNGHGGNHSVMQVAAAELSQRHGVVVAAASWWQLAEDELIARGALESGDVPGHAGAFETSIMLALHPELVRDLPDRPVTGPGRVGLKAPLMVRHPDDWAAIDGFTDSPSRGDAPSGAAYLGLGVTAVAAAIEQLADKS